MIKAFLVFYLIYALGEDRTHITSFGGLCVIHYTTRASDLSIIQIERAKFNLSF